ncbi:precorrin-2 dehydrogenase/sirohydrochlorin ferrochelatase family protein [Croceibacterium selenioxidans]
MRSLPLFHRVAGQSVIVLGEGAAAEAKRRLVERAGAYTSSELEDGLLRGARLAFVAHEDAAACEADAARLRAAGVLVNTVDRPDLCDFTVPSLLDRDPVLIAVGTSGASAGLAKQLRLRLEALLPADLGRLAETLNSARAKLRARWPIAADRRMALDAALAEGGALDPLKDGAAVSVDEWLAEAPAPVTVEAIELTISSDDPDELTLRQARLLGSADAILFEPEIGSAVLDRARADAVRRTLPHDGSLPRGLVLVLRRAPNA